MKEMKNMIRNISLSVCVALVPAITGCSKWTRPEALDLAPQISSLSDEYLAGIRAFKNTDHKMLVLGMDAVSGGITARYQHLMSLPDSADYIYIRNLSGGLNGILAAEIDEVREKKGTKVLADVDYVLIENAWNDIQDAAEAAGEEPGTQEEFESFVAGRTKAALECMDRYGCDGVMVSYTGSASASMASAGRTAFVGAVTEWWTANGGDREFMARGYLQNIARFVDGDDAFFDLCDYLLFSVGDATSSGVITGNVNSYTRYGVPSDRYIFEVTVPSASDPAQVGMTPSAAAGWIVTPSETEEFSKLGLCVENAQDDYFNIGNNYANIRRAITVLNTDTL